MPYWPTWGPQAIGVLSHARLCPHKNSTVTQEAVQKAWHTPSQMPTHTPTYFCFSCP